MAVASCFARILPDSLAVLTALVEQVDSVAVEYALAQRREAKATNACGRSYERPTLRLHRIARARLFGVLRVYR